jgi:mitogen-activated protein kinase 15
MESALAKECLDQITITKKKTFAQFFPNNSEDALDLLKNLLVLNPNHRLTADQALKHPYIAEIRDFSDIS